MVSVRHLVDRGRHARGASAATVLCALTVGTGWSLGALAQTAADQGPAPAAAAGDAAPLQEVEVTGTRIKRKDLESSSPLVTIDSETLEQRAGLNIESYLNQLPNYNPAQVPTLEHPILPRSDQARIERGLLGSYRFSTPRTGEKNWVAVTRIR